VVVEELHLTDDAEGLEALQQTGRLLLSRQKYDHGKSLMEDQSLLLGVSGSVISIFYTVDAHF
jgi:hypothetical protein